MKIVLVGGGSGGTVSPLLAVAQEIKKIHPRTRFLFIGTKNGPEKIMAKQAGLPFVRISCGKWRRYLSIQNLFTPLLISKGYFESLRILKWFKPDCVFGVGSFVQVPVIWAAKTLGIPSVIHQQDFMKSLANTLCQFAAKKITVSFKENINDFRSGIGIFYNKNIEKVFFTGNPSSIKKAEKKSALEFFGLNRDFPVLLVLGGGTGAEGINKIISQSFPALGKIVQVLHISGKGKSFLKPQKNYVSLDFTSEMDKAYGAADIVLCRAGLSTITEISRLKKVALVVPMPNSHQEINALVLIREKAAVVLRQDLLTPNLLIKIVRKLLFSITLQKQMETNIGRLMPADASERIANIILDVSGK